ncbi:hypothetical protein ACRZPB_004622, partial [Vibrio parahaemolyticus]
LPETQKKEFYKLQSKKLKDPDTYATLNWFFLRAFKLTFHSPSVGDIRVTTIVLFAENSKAVQL